MDSKPGRAYPKKRVPTQAAHAEYTVKTNTKHTFPQIAQNRQKLKIVRKQPPKQLEKQGQNSHQQRNVLNITKNFFQKIINLKKQLTLLIV